MQVVFVDREKECNFVSSITVAKYLYYIKFLSLPRNLLVDDIYFEVGGQNRNDSESIPAIVVPCSSSSFEFNSFCDYLGTNRRLTRTGRRHYVIEVKETSIDKTARAQILP